MAYYPVQQNNNEYMRGYSYPPTYSVSTRDTYNDPQVIAAAEAAAAAARTDDPISTLALSLSSFINKVFISHPCTVLRRQCQVHPNARRLHLTPVTLVPVVINMIKKDGIFTLWKGFDGYCVVYGMAYVVEIIISDVFGLPKTIVYNGSSEKFLKHVALKTWTTVVMTPFYISSFIETVRSGSGLKFSESNILDVVYRGFGRLKYDLFGGIDSGRKLPVLYLAAPTVTYVVSHYLISRWAYNYIYSMARRYVLRKAPQERTRFHSILPDLFAAMTSSLAADLLCYPLETVLHRLYIQGTRTLIDNLDNGVSAISINAKYNGFFDCFSSILKNEGFMTLYGGVGAIAVQYCIQFCVVRGIRYIFEHALQAPQVNVNHPNIRSGPTSQIQAHPSAQFAAAEIPLDNVSPAKTSKSSMFPTFAQTSANIDIPPVGQIYNNFNETSNVFGGSTSPPIFQSPNRHRDDFLLSATTDAPNTDLHHQIV
uniref:Solute carrier family 25 member 46 n=1 Tax=Panagrolaimus sp. PS1159 TaxID=55785 RepID=A0AC35GTF5_9BILA